MKKSNKVLLSTLLLCIGVSVTSCNNDDSSSISISQPSISTGGSTSVNQGNVRVRSVDNNINITRFLNNRNSETNNFMEKGRNLLVGDDNYFKFKPIVRFVNEKNQLVEVSDVEFDVKLSIKDDSDAFVNVNSLNDYVDSLDNKNCEIDFKDSAIGKTFKISVVPNKVNASDVGKFTKEFEFQVVDGFNVYSAKELAYFNKNRKSNDDYETSTGIRINDAWEKFKTANGLTDNSEKEAFILQTDISITDDDVPQEFFYHKGDKDYDATLDGTLRDYSTLYYHTFDKNDDSYSLAFYGNYFTLDASKLSLVKKELDYDGKVMEKKEVISHAVLFRTEKNDEVTGESFLMRDVNLIGNAPRTEDLSLGGGIIMHKNHSVNALLENNTSNSWFITYFTEYLESNYVINKCYARDNFNSFIYNYGGNVTIKNSDMEGTGGPIIIQDQVYYSNGPTNNIGNAVIENSRLENWVSGEEGWFQLTAGNLAMSLVTGIKAMDGIFNAYGRTFTTTKTINDKPVQLFNFICVNKNSKDLTASCEGSIKIDDGKSFDFGKSDSMFKDFYSDHLKSPIFQTSAGGYSYTDSKNGLLDATNKTITNKDDLMFSGDYLAIYYFGLMLTFGYYPLNK